MSRAFVKEDDDLPPLPPPEREVSSAPNRVTPRGARLIHETVAALEHDLSAADPESARIIRRDLQYWHARSATMQIVATDPAPEAVGLGVRVAIRRGGADSVFTIVGEDEADPAEGRIAWVSPLARALDGAEPGEVIEFEAGGRSEPITILSVAAARDDG